MTQNLGLYLHIPFCQKKCHYCAFLTFVQHDHLIKDYLAALVQEVQLYGKHYAYRRVDSIYFGGGTPSYVAAEDLMAVLTAIRQTFKVDPHCEVTVELNPESVTKDRLQVYLDHGVNRFSMGVQSFDDEVLDLMGRLHTGQEAVAKVELMQAMGCQNISLDLIFANPRQTLASFQRDLEILKTLKIQHLSAYALIYKAGTPFDYWRKIGFIQETPEDIDRQMYHLLQGAAPELGLKQYETSSFAKENFRSRHNLKYWRQEDYLGLGLGASSNVGSRRYDNQPSFLKYFEAVRAGDLPIQPKTILDLTADQQEKEYMVLTTRLVEGFSLAAMNEKFGIDCLVKYGAAIDKHLNLGTIQIQDGRLFLTAKGQDLADQFYVDLM